MNQLKPTLAAILLLLGFASPVVAEQNRWEDAIRAFEEKDKESPPPKNAVLFVGSSSIVLWDLQRWFPDLPTINRGFGGSQIADSIEFATRIIIPHAPKTVVLYAGDNDIDFGKSPQTVLEDYKRFVRTVRAGLPEARILFIAIKPSIARWNLVDKMRVANALIREETEKDVLLEYVDIDAPMMGEDGKPQADLFLDDGLHLNDEGYRLWTGLLLPYLEKEGENSQRTHEMSDADTDEDFLSGTVLSTMKKASEFMMNRVTNRGGFLMLYSEDLTERWGEIPARESMIWVQDPGTVGVGQAHLKAYQATGDFNFLRYAEQSADAIVTGQHPSGGWHYFIDFDPSGVEEWYEDVASKCWGWEEFYYYCGNCTFDDEVTVGAARFLLDLYLETDNEEFRAPLLKAIDFVLAAQRPNGGWPQRYPPCTDGTKANPDYTQYYTYNDAVIPTNIDFLLEASERLGKEEYRKAAIRGMDFVKASQLPPPQAGWAQQYDEDMQPAAARSCEPKAISLIDTLQCIQNLQKYYKITGDRKYLEGIPKAIDWIAKSALPSDHMDGGKYTHAIFYEPGTNRPLYAHREGTTKKTGRYWVDSNPTDILRGYGYRITLNVDHFRNEYDRVSNLSPEDAYAEYSAAREAAHKTPKVNADEVQLIVDSLDSRGAWVEDLSLPDYQDYMNNPPKHFRGISTRTYIKNMRTLAYFLVGEELAK